MCKYLLHNFFWKTQKPGSVKRGQTVENGEQPWGTQKKNATPTIANEDLGQTNNWSKLVAAYLPVARLTILDRLVTLFICSQLLVGVSIVYF